MADHSLWEQIQHLPPEQAATLLEIYLDQPETQIEALAVLDRLGPCSIATAAGQPLTELQSRANARFRKRLAPSRLSHLEAELGAMASLRDRRWPNFLAELFAPGYGNDPAFGRLQVETSTRMDALIADAKATPDQKAALALLVVIETAGGRLDAVLAEHKRRLASTLAADHTQNNLEAACKALDKGDVETAAGALLEAVTAAKCLSVIPPDLQAVAEAVDVAKRSAARLAALNSQVSGLMVTSWDSLAEADTLCAEALPLSRRFPALSAHHPQLEPACNRLDEQAAAFIRAQAAKATDLCGIMRFRRHILDNCPNHLARVQPEWFAASWKVEEASLLREIEDAGGVHDLGQIRNRIEARTEGQDWPEILPKLADLCAWIIQVQAAWEAVSRGDGETAAALSSENRSLPQTLVSRAETLVHGQKLIEQVSRRDAEPSPANLEELSRLTEDSSLGVAATSVLAELAHRRHRHALDMAFTALDMDKICQLVRGLHDWPPEVLGALSHLADLLEAPPFTDHASALWWWQAWEAALSALLDKVDCASIPQVLAETLLGRERGRLRQWHALLRDQLAPPRLEPAKAAAIAGDLRCGPPMLAPLGRLFLQAQLVGEVERAADQGNIELASEKLTTLEVGGDAPVGEMQRLRLLIALRQAQLDGGTAHYRLWVENGATILRLLPDRAAGALAEALATAWHDDAAPEALALANLAADPRLCAADAEMQRPLQYWAGFVRAEAPLSAGSQAPKDFEALAAVLFAHADKDWRTVADEPLRKLVGGWTRKGYGIACAWAALVLRDWPEVTATIATAPAKLVSHIAGRLDTVMNTAAQWVLLEADGAEGFRKQVEDIDRDWRAFEQSLRGAGLHAVIPAPPPQLARARELADALPILAQGMHSLEQADFRSDDTRRQYQDLDARMIGLHRHHQHMPALRETQQRLGRLSELFALRARFARYVEGCWWTVDAKSLSQDDVYDELAQVADDMAQLLAHCDQSAAPGAKLLWRDCWAALKAADPLLDKPTPPSGHADLIEILSELKEHDQGMRLSTIQLERLIPSAVVEDPIHLSALAAALTAARPLSSRQELRLRQFCLRDIMPSLLSLHAKSFPDWLTPTT